MPLVHREKMIPTAKITHVYGMGSPNADRPCMMKMPIPRPKNMNKITTTGLEVASSDASTVGVTKRNSARTLSTLHEKDLLKPSILLTSVWTIACNNFTLNGKEGTNWFKRLLGLAVAAKLTSSSTRGRRQHLGVTATLSNPIVLRIRTCRC